MAKENGDFMAGCVFFLFSMLLSGIVLVSEWPNYRDTQWMVISFMGMGVLSLVNGFYMRFRHQQIGKLRPSDKVKEWLYSFQNWTSTLSEFLAPILLLASAVPGQQLPKLTLWACFLTSVVGIVAWLAILVALNFYGWTIASDGVHMFSIVLCLCQHRFHF